MKPRAARPQSSSLPPPEGLRGPACALRPQAPVTLLLDCDLRRNAFVNIDFRNAAQTVIPLHLSLRRDSAAIIANRWTAKGWRREVVIPAPLRRGLHRLRLQFDRVRALGVRVTIHLDDACLATLDALPRLDRAGRLGLRHGFPGLADLGWMTWPDGLQSLRILEPAPEGQLMLNARFELVLRTRCAAPVLSLNADGETRPFLRLEAGSDGCGADCFVAPVPGRVWRGAAMGPVTLCANDDTGAEIAQLVLTRDHLNAMLQAPSAEWLAQYDQFARLQMLEHVHFADLWSVLPDELSQRLHQTASRYHKAGFAPPLSANLPVPRARLPGRAARACDGFHRAISQPDAGPATAIFAAMVATHRLSGPEIGQLAFLLSEWFCLHADPCELVRCSADHGVFPVPDKRQIWMQTAALPLIWAQGDWAACERILKNLPNGGADWIVTPALGWCAQAIATGKPDLTGRQPQASLRHEMGLALLDAVARKADAYMAQTSCSRLIEGVLDLLDARTCFPDAVQQRYRDLVLRAYGLCPDFWAAFDARDPAHMPAGLGPWRVAFAAVYASCLARDRPGIARHAQPFLSRPIAGNATLRRLALSMRALPVDGAGLPDTAALIAHATDGEINEAALRWLAFPRSDAQRATLPLTCETPVHRAACAGLRAASPDISRPPMAQAQQRLAQMHAELADMRFLCATDIDALIAAAQPLFGPQGGAVGVPVLLSMAERLSRRGQRDLAQRCVAACLPALESAEIRRAPAVVLALARFVALCPDAGLRAALEPRALSSMTPAPPDREDPQAARLRAISDPLADTVVAVISCHAYLKTRVPEAMSAWGDSLAQRGVPVITVVGRAPGQPPGIGPRFDGQLLQLDAPDDYEGLPQKSLALIEWALTQTRFGRIFKIDDDCFLDGQTFFADLAFLNTRYFGRPLRRAFGEMDRSWHMAHARSARGRFELDKSPEPAGYADGATGYILTRQAMAAVVAERDGAQGRALEQVSFMEDKLVGDLLALAGIEVSGPNYDLAVFRRSAPDLPPVSQFHCGFLPFAGSGIKLAHLDSGGAPRAAREALRSPWPQPMKIWPLSRPAGLGWARHGLDLISPPEHLARAEAAEVAVIAVMRNELFVLEHFLSHYRGLGVGGFLIVDNGSDDGTLECLRDQPDVAVFSTDTPYRDSAYGVLWQEALLAQFRMGQWSLVADADELAFWSLPDAHGKVHGDLPALLRGPEFSGAEAVRLRMFDLYPKGPLSDIRFTRAPFLEADHVERSPFRTDWQGRGPWSNAQTLTSALRHRLVAEAGHPARASLFVAQKYALLRYHPFMRLSTGLHYIAGAQVAERELGFAHFKYHAQFHAKAQAEVARAQHFNNAEEYRNYLLMLAEGRDRLFDPALSVRLHDCPDLRAICALPPKADPPRSLSAPRRSQPSAAAGAGSELTAEA